MTGTLARRAVAEFTGTAFLVAAVVGSGIAAVRLSPGQTGLELLESSLATGTILTALILALQPVSAAFNPVVTLIERALGTITSKDATTLIAAQAGGAIMGSVVANVMFGLAPVTWSGQHRAGPGLWLGEVIATLGLVLVIFGTMRSGGARQVGYAVGGYIAAAYWFTSSTSFANPAVTIGRMFSASFAGIAPASAPVFIAMQLVGGLAGYGLIRFLYPDTAATAAAVIAQPAAAWADR